MHIHTCPSCSLFMGLAEVVSVLPAHHICSVEHGTPQNANDANQEIIFPIILQGSPCLL